MVVPGRDEVDAARRFLAGYLPATRLVPAPGLARIVGARVSLKLEGELPTGSFKPRGALWAIHRRRERRPLAEVAAASTGNHGAAVAWAARELGLAARIFLPERPNPVKRATIAEQGATIVETGRDLAAAAAAARAYATRPGVHLVDDATDPDLPAGPATIAAELLDDAPDVDSVYVPVGDTALVRGVAAVLADRRPEVRVVGVQAAVAPAYTLSWRAGHPVPTDTCDTIADGLATRTPDATNVDAIRRLVHDMVLVTEDQLLAAVRHLLLVEHVVAEPAAAATTAAALLHHPHHRHTALLVTGANLAPATLARVAGIDEPRATARA